MSYKCCACGSRFDEPHHESWVEHVDGIGDMPMGQDRCPNCGSDEIEEVDEDAE